ncbi:hypothetical protein GH714_001813 [Hevea brasiliensis]|uniref:Nitrate reductase (NADH) n=1 Tax=Hevea brasiliensis TaxID=3981 RepID=A0A6A6L5X6_HEVBR|nr:hypothetical protein GH714_001813 [Hevea brasiliensis]
MADVKKHNSADSSWIIVHGHVYDCTRFLKDHPGGTDSILINAGTDCTEEFDAIHSDKAKKMLEDYRIGELVDSTACTSDSNASSPNNSVHGASNMPLTRLAPVKETAPIKEIVPALRNVALVPRKHIFLCATIDEKLCMRAYTPTSTIDVVGYFDLVIKIYCKGVHPKFPNGGLMSQHLDSLPLGSIVDVKGPLGHIEYTGTGNFLVHGKPKFAKRLTMLAGGTGITPIYQVIQAILKDPEDDTEMYVVYANRTEDDILLRDELDSWAKQHGDRLKVWYVVQESIKEGWQYSVGFVTESILRERVPEGSDDTLALACGPPPMIQFSVQPNLDKLNYDIKNSLLVF